MPHPIRKRRTQRDNVTRRLVMDVIHDIRDRPLTVKHTVTHAPRPPAPRPSRLTIVYRLQNGQEWREYVPMTGQASWETGLPACLRDMQLYGGPPESVRYEFGYEDGRKW